MLKHITTLSLALILFACGGTQSDPEPEVENATAPAEAPAPKAAPYLLVTQEANILLNPNTNATVVAEARAGDVFTLNEVSGDWYEIYMFSGEPRYLHKSVAQDTTASPPLPSSANTACGKIVSAQDRATREAEQKFPNDFSKQIDYERLLMDKYEMPVFHKYALPPAQSSKLTVECAQNL